MVDMQKIARIVIASTIGIVPVFFLPLTRDAFEFNKFMLLLASALILLVLFALQTLKKGRVDLVLGSADKALALLMGAYLLSYIVSSPNKIYALTQNGSVGVLFTMYLFYFLSRQFLRETAKQAKQYVEMPLLISASVLSLLMLIFSSGILSSLPVPAWLKVRSFTPAGSLTMYVTFAILSLTLTITRLIEAFKKNDSFQKMFMGTVTVLLLLGIGSSAILLARPENKPVFLPHSTGWSIALNALKYPRSALFGVGPSNYVNAFTVGKTPELNVTEYWRFRSSASSNWYFQIMTDAGILGIAALIFLLYTLFRYPKKSVGVISFLLISLFLPANFLILFWFFCSLLLFDLAKASVYGLPADKRHGEKEMLSSAYDQIQQAVSERNLVRPLISIASVVLIIAAATIAYFAGRVYVADATMRQGIIKAYTTENALTYELQRRAVILNPYDPDFRLIFAQTNLALANLISQQQGLTDEQKKTVTTLVTQSVNNGKLAVRLFPSAATWENLAAIYKVLIPAVQGADNWTRALYQQAISIDPSNPQLHVSLGGLYFSQKKYDLAIQEFGQAIKLKGNYANAWYNIANTFREVKNYEAARAAYQNTLGLLKEGTVDYDKAKSEMDALPAKAEAKQPTQLEELTTPESSSSSKLTPDTAPSEEKLNPSTEASTEESTNASEAGKLKLPVRNTPTE